MISIVFSLILGAKLKLSGMIGLLPNVLVVKVVYLFDLERTGGLII